MQMLMPSHERMVKVHRTSSMWRRGEGCDENGVLLSVSIHYHLNLYVRMHLTVFVIVTFGLMSRMFHTM